MAFKSVTGTLSGTGRSNAFEIPGQRGPASSEVLLNIVVSGTFSATVEIQRSLDNSVSWHTLSKDADGAPASYTAPFAVRIGECETPALYAVNCSAFTSGTINFRISQ